MCKHGCRYTTIQKAVNASGKNATINVKPGKYVEGVIVSGHKHDGLHIIGVEQEPRPRSSSRARTPRARAAPPRTGSRATSVNNLVLENMKAEHFAANGFFINQLHTAT